MAARRHWALRATYCHMASALAWLRGCGWTCTRSTTPVSAAIQGRLSGTLVDAALWRRRPRRRTPTSWGNWTLLRSHSLVRATASGRRLSLPADALVRRRLCCCSTSSTTASSSPRLGHRHQFLGKTEISGNPGDSATSVKFGTAGLLPASLRAHDGVSSLGTSDGKHHALPTPCGPALAGFHTRLGSTLRMIAAATIRGLAFAFAVCALALLNLATAVIRVLAPTGCGSATAILMVLVVFGQGAAAINIDVSSLKWGPNDGPSQLPMWLRLLAMFCDGHRAGRPLLLQVLTLRGRRESLELPRRGGLPARRPQASPTGLCCAARRQGRTRGATARGGRDRSGRSPHRSSQVAAGERHSAVRLRAWSRPEVVVGSDGRLLRPSYPAGPDLGGAADQPDSRVS